MNLPLFYSPSIPANGESLELEEENARHIVQVLLMKPGDGLRLTDGKGMMSECRISATAKKSCTVTILSGTAVAPPSHKVTVAISLLKNTGRFEWFLEKAAETGIHAVVPLICHRTERQVFRARRLRSILISAMLQSQQSWLTEISEPVIFSSFISSFDPAHMDHFYIAHCEDHEKKELASMVSPGHSSSLIMIGPEGDFTPEEINAAKVAGAVPVQLGATRLRTETAGITAAILLKQLSSI
jgi:16S rRNA (uracil1498-N3)-methyltransferase